jgi:hypothetical protein
MKSSERWDFYFLRVDDNPAFNFIDIGIASSAPMSVFPTLSYLSVKMNHPRPDGLSSGEEYETLLQIEEQLIEIVNPSFDLIYVGRSTHSGDRDFFFYSNGEVLAPIVEKLMAAWPSYQFSCGHRPDPDWKIYWRFLYPSPEDFQRMGNRDVLEQLAELGDDHGVSRPIDHFALLPEGGDIQGFIRALPDGLVGQPDIRLDDDGSSMVSFQIFGSPGEIDDVTIELSRSALEHGGKYDGWGCSVEKPAGI